MRTTQSMMRRALGAGALALLISAGGAQAASLDKEICDKLKAEQAQLEGTGARVNMAKGPEWAKANLGPEKLGEIKRLIEVEELVLFRCQGRPLVVLPPETEPNAGKGEDAKEDGKEPPGKEAAKDAKATSAEKGASAAPAAKKAAPQPGKVPASKDAPAKKADASAKAAKAGNPAPAKAAKAKSKADDAYRPPGQDPSADPFAKQLAPGDKK